MIKGRHSTPAEMLMESLDELLFAVKYCVTYKKSDRKLWVEPHALGGILGFPATTLLFTIVDTIGSYCDNLEVEIDGKKRKIRPGDVKSHYYILNSEYFNLNLSYNDILQLYRYARSTLSHNSIIGKEILLHPRGAKPFIKVNSQSGKGRYTIYILSFYEACMTAVALFKEDINDIVPSSENGSSA